MTHASEVATNLAIHKEDTNPEPAGYCHGRATSHHSGNIFKGAANGSAGSPVIDGSRTARPKKLNWPDTSNQIDAVKGS